MPKAPRNVTGRVSPGEREGPRTNRAVFLKPSTEMRLEAEGVLHARPSGQCSNAPSAHALTQALTSVARVREGCGGIQELRVLVRPGEPFKTSTAFVREAKRDCDICSRTSLMQVHL